MKSIIIILFPLFIFSQNTEENKRNNLNQHQIEWNTNLLFESNGLNKDFLNTFLYGGYISNDLKDKWINLGSEENVIYSEINNSISYRNLKYNIGISLADRNIINASFPDDLMRIYLFGNFDYQNKTIDFSNTNIRIDRFQQYKLDYTYSINSTNIQAGISYLSGNHHTSFIIENGTFYTAPLGVYLDISYDINANITDTSNLNMFANNGNGMAFDIDIDLTLSSNTLNFYIQDLGFINWKEESITYNTDSSFIFAGVEVENIFTFNDSILEEYNNDNYIQKGNLSFKSYIPANIGFSIAHNIKNKRVQSLSGGVNLRWQPYQNEKAPSFARIGQGIKESNYTPLLWLSAVSNIKYLDIIPTLSYGGYSSDINLGVALSKGKKSNFILGTQHLEDIFSGNNAKAVSIYFQILTQF